MDFEINEIVELTGIISIREIDLEDGTFEIRRFAGHDRLRDSLERFGILDPPWIWRRGGRNIVVDGFKRLRWAAQKGIESIVCRIFPEDFSYSELWQRRIERGYSSLISTLRRRRGSYPYCWIFFRPGTFPPVFFPR